MKSKVKNMNQEIHCNSAVVGILLFNYIRYVGVCKWENLEKKIKGVKTFIFLQLRHVI